MDALTIAVAISLVVVTIAFAITLVKSVTHNSDPKPPSGEWSPMQYNHHAQPEDVVDATLVSDAEAIRFLSPGMYYSHTIETKAIPSVTDTDSKDEPTSAA